MDVKDIRDIIREFIHEELPLKEVVMAKEYIDEKWDALLQSALLDLFHDVGLERIDAERDGKGSRIEVELDNGDRVIGIATMNPLSGHIIVNDSFRKELNGPQAMRLVINMRDVWDEYSNAKGMNVTI